MSAAGEDVLAWTGTHRRDRRRGGIDSQPGLPTTARAWLTVLTDRSWWSLDVEDRSAYRSGVALAQWTRRQVRRSGLCSTCWERESGTDICPCEGGDCRTFTTLLQELTTDHPRGNNAGRQTPPTDGDRLT